MLVFKMIAFSMLGLFCKRALQKSRYSAKETYDMTQNTSLCSADANENDCFLQMCVHPHTHTHIQKTGVPLQNFSFGLDNNEQLL